MCELNLQQNCDHCYDEDQTHFHNMLEFRCRLRVIFSFLLLSLLLLLLMQMTQTFDFITAKQKQRRRTNKLRELKETYANC